MGGDIKPILFSGPMVRAIQADRKTITRRLTGLKDQHIVPLTELRCPYDPGDILWVREAWAELACGYVYRADAEAPYGWGPDDRWHPSIFLPKAACRLFLRVTDIRMERLRQIADADAIREGVSSREEFAALWDSLRRPADRAKYGWDADPWVWRIQFERCGKPEGWPHGV